MLVNSSTGQEKGSLLWLLNHTRTAFGARRLRHWVSHPLRIAAAITARLDAVQQLREDGGDGPSGGFFRGRREPLSLM